MANSSTKPKTHKAWLSTEVEKEIIKTQKETKYGRKRLYIHLKRKFE